MKSRVYIGGLDYAAQESDVLRFFRGYGRIDDINIKRGYAFLDFANKRDAEDAIRDLSGEMLLGRRITVQLAMGEPVGYDRVRYGYEKLNPTRTDNQLIVKNLSSQVDWRYLKEFMSQCGRVTFADCHKEIWNRGVVDFVHREDLKYAMKKLNGAKLEGRRIQLVENTKNSCRSRSRSPEKKRDYERRRSHSRDRNVRSLSRYLSRCNSKDRSRSRSRSRSRDRCSSKSRLQSTVNVAGSSANESESSQRSKSVSRFLSTRSVKTVKKNSK